MQRAWCGRYHHSGSRRFSVVWPWPMPRIDTGFFLQSLARSGEVTRMQTAPSEIRQQSNMCKGSTIMREFW